MADILSSFTDNSLYIKTYLTPKGIILRSSHVALYTLQVAMDNNGPTYGRFVQSDVEEEGKRYIQRQSWNVHNANYEVYCSMDHFTVGVKPLPSQHMYRGGYCQEGICL